jgi:hypothetical protein
MERQKKKINADIKNYGAMICEETECRWKRVCANHTSAGDFRSEDGSRPVVHLEQGEVFCETFYSEGDGCEYHEIPTHVDHDWNPCDGQDAQMLVKDLVEKTDNFQI